MTRSSAGATTHEGFADVVARLAAAQKPRAPGAPAYSIYVNRPLGRLLAAAAYLGGLTPNVVTVISAVFTFSARCTETASMRLDISAQEHPEEMSWSRKSRSTTGGNCESL